MSNQRYMMRGVSASKVEVHNAIKTPTVQARSPHWLICTGKKQVIFLFGKALHKMH